MPNTGSKYGARRAPCNCGGTDHWHDSRKERDRCLTLHLYQLRGEIANLELQVPYPFWVNGILVATYYADFRYRRGDEVVVEDVKGMRLPLYAIKAKLMLACYGITILET